MAEFTLTQDTMVFETIWEYRNDEHIIIVQPVTLLTYNYQINDSNGIAVQTKWSTDGVTADELVSQLEKFYIENQEDTPINFQEWAIQPQKNLLIFFPSYIMHKPNENTTDSVPSNKFLSFI